MRRAVSVLITSVLTGFVVINLSAGRSDGQAHGGASPLPHSPRRPVEEVLI